MAEVIQVPSSADFEAAYEKVKGDDFFITVFTGGENAEGVNWCPDCVTAKPKINDIIVKNTDCKILWCTVPTRNEWVGVADHPYKIHPDLKCSGVPNVFLFADGQVVMKAESEADFQNDELLMAIAKHE
jgi:hypothetical protein